MRDFFDPATYQEFVQRIEQLSPAAERQWGKMTVAEMLAHCVKGMALPGSQKKLPRVLIGYIFGKMAKKKLTGDEPFTRDLPTDPTFVTLGTDPAFATAKTELLALMKKIHRGGPQSLNPNPHPFFGKMSGQEWSGLISNHLDHHLRQFGG